MVLFCIPCLVLVSYFAIASLFFPKYRIYIKDGWKCFIDKLKGRECSVSFDNKMRISIATWFAEKNMTKIGKFLYKKKNFDWTLIILGIVFTVLTVYLFIVLVGFSINPPCTDNGCSI